MNTFAVCLSGTNAICVAALGITTLEWRGTKEAERVDNAVMIIQLIVLVGGALFTCFGLFGVLFRFPKHSSTCHTLERRN